MTQNQIKSFTAEIRLRLHLSDEEEDILNFMETTTLNTLNKNTNTDIIKLTTINGDWEGVYIKGLLCAEEHTINMSMLSDRYKFSISNVVTKELTVNDSKTVNEQGYLPYQIKNLSGTYE